LDLNGFTDSRSSGNFMPEAKLSYDLNDNVMLYANLGKSAKAGGFASATNARAATLEYDDESVVGGEIGFKSTLLDGRAQFNAAVFRSNFKDLQVNSFIVNNGVTEAVIANAAEAISQGVEVDGRFNISDWFTVGGSLALLDAEFDSFGAAPCNRQLTPTPGGTSCDLTGMALPFAADYSGNVFADFSFPISDDFSFDGGVLYAFSDNYFTDGTLDATAVQGSWQRLSGHIGISKGDNYKLEVIGSNLTNEKVLGSTQPFGGSYNLGYLDPPRMVMLKATVGFGN
jgi:outer membrane receptor protein involved in Fe transport